MLASGGHEMKVRVPLLIKDKMTEHKLAEVKRTQGFEITGQPFFLDGPVTRRVAVLDLDAKPGVVHRGAPFRVPATGGRLDLWRRL
jgi:hypothetical protein